jgi:hypothetical protein
MVIASSEAKATIKVVDRDSFWGRVFMRGFIIQFGLWCQISGILGQNPKLGPFLGKKTILRAKPPKCKPLMGFYLVVMHLDARAVGRRTSIGPINNSKRRELAIQLSFHPSAARSQKFAVT